MREWMPIQSAPKDGTFVFAGTRSKMPDWLLIVPYPFYQKFDGEKWVGKDGKQYEPQPTHWRR